MSYAVNFFVTQNVTKYGKDRHFFNYIFLKYRDEITLLLLKKKIRSKLNLLVNAPWYSHRLICVRSVHIVEHKKRNTATERRVVVLEEFLIWVILVIQCYSGLYTKNGVYI